MTGSPRRAQRNRHRSRTVNVEFDVQPPAEGKEFGLLVLTIDLDETFGDTASKKSWKIASTHGNVTLAEFGFRDIVVSVNVYEKKGRADHVHTG